MATKRSPQRERERAMFPGRLVKRKTIPQAFMEVIDHDPTGKYAERIQSTTSRKRTKMEHEDIDHEDEGTELVGAEGTTISTTVIDFDKPYVVNVSFDQDPERYGQLFSYWTDQEFKQGDLAVVQKPDETYMVVRIITMEQRNHRATKWIIDKVDTVAYEERRQRQLKKEQLKLLMNKAVKKLDEEAKLQAYADKDPAFKALLDEYKALDV